MFTDQTWQIQMQAVAESQGSARHGGPAAQLLLAFVTEPSGTGRAALRTFGLDTDRVRSELLQRLAVRSQPTGASEFDREATKALIAQAGREVQALSHGYVAPEHLLLALVCDEGIAGPLLRDFGLSIASARRAVMRALAYPLEKGCPMCGRLRSVRKRKEPAWIADLTRMSVLLGDNQGCRGWCVLALRGHAEHLAELPSEAQHCVWDDVSRVASAIRAVFPASGKGGGPPRINYECLGNVVPHIHWHVIPRHADDPDTTKSVWGVA